MVSLLGVCLILFILMLKRTEPVLDDMTHPDPVIPSDPLEAPVYGDDPVFPKTDYLGISLNWRRVNDLDALFRDGDRYSVKEFIKPDQVMNYSFPDEPVDRAMAMMFLRTIQVPYIYDKSDFDYWKYPEETLLYGGDCEDTSFLLASMMKTRGIDCYMAAGYFVGDQYYAHAWVVARIPMRGEFLFETTLDLPPASLWTEVHNSPIAQHYIPYIYWNQQEVFIASEFYRYILAESKTLSGEPEIYEDNKVDNIHEIWSIEG